MRSYCVVALISIALFAPLICTGQKDVGVEEKLAYQLRVGCYDYDCGPPVSARLLMIADRDTVVTSLVKTLDAYQPNDSRGDKALVILTVGALAEFKDVKAVPALRRIAQQSDKDLRGLCVRIIGATDVKGNREFLVKMLHDDYYPVRQEAARGLAELDDTDVLAELDVQASRERSRGASLELQRLADNMRERIRLRHEK
jgi:HEAT repeat protein